MSLPVATLGFTCKVTISDDTARAGSKSFLGQFGKHPQVKVNSELEVSNRGEAERIAGLLGRPQPWRAQGQKT